MEDPSKIDESRPAEPQDAPAGDNGVPYEPPRIITHSADQLKGVSLSVNACSSYDPGEDPL